jgi:hypothetical protein
MAKKGKPKLQEPADWADYLWIKLNAFLIDVERLRDTRQALAIATGHAPSKRPGLDLQHGAARASSITGDREMRETPAELARGYTKAKLRKDRDAREARLAAVGRLLWSGAGTADADTFTAWVQRNEAATLFNAIHAREWEAGREPVESRIIEEIAGQLDVDPRTVKNRLDNGKAGPSPRFRHERGDGYRRHKDAAVQRFKKASPTVKRKTSR